MEESYYEKQKSHYINLSLAFIFMFSLGCVSAATQTRNVVVYTTSDTSGIVICINEHKATCTNSKAKSTVSTKYLVTGGTQKVSNLDSGKIAKVKITGQLGNAKQTKTSTIRNEAFRYQI